MSVESYTMTRVFVEDALNICIASFSKHPNKKIRRDYLELIVYLRSNTNVDLIQDILNGKSIWVEDHENTSNDGGVVVSAIYFTFLSFMYTRYKVLVSVFQDYDEGMNDKVHLGTAKESTYKMAVENCHLFLKVLMQSEPILLAAANRNIISVSFDNDALIVDLK